MELDINTLRSIVTVVALVSFVGIVVWAWSGRNKQAFDEAARLPFEDGEETKGEAPTLTSLSAPRGGLSLLEAARRRLP